MKKILPLLAIYCMLFSPTQLRAEIWYIIPNGTGSGQTNWGNASGNLQSVINLAQSGDEIWVAQGTYVPTIKAGNGPEARDNKKRPTTWGLSVSTSYR